jgi:hypothetical protein
VPGGSRSRPVTSCAAMPRRTARTAGPRPGLLRAGRGGAVR